MDTRPSAPPPASSKQDAVRSPSQGVPSPSPSAAQPPEAASAPAPAGSSSPRRPGEGWLDASEIQGVVRRSFGRFRLCYEAGLRRDARLEGLVTTEFTIERDGSVKAPRRGSATNLPDEEVVQCVVKAFEKMQFPRPEGGVVKVVYPVSLNPGG